MVGIPTVLISLVPENSKQMGPPRIFTPINFKLGNCLGGPFLVDLQRAVLRDALSRWEAREEAGVLWEREYSAYRGADDSWKQILEEE